MIELYCYGSKSGTRVGIGLGLFAGFERQRFCELNRDTADKVIDIIDPADRACAGETCHIERFIGPEARNAKASGQTLAGIWAVLVGAAAKSCPCTADVNHLSLEKHFVKVLGEPDGPIITQSLFLSSLKIRFHCKGSKSFRYPPIGRFEKPLYD